MRLLSRKLGVAIRIEFLQLSRSFARSRGNRRRLIVNTFGFSGSVDKVEENNSGFLLFDLLLEDLGMLEICSVGRDGRAVQAREIAVNLGGFVELAVAFLHLAQRELR